MEVAIWFLGRGHSRDQRLVPPLEVGGVLPAEFPSHGLEQLVDLGVDELDAGVPLQAQAMVPAAARSKLPVQPMRSIHAWQWAGSCQRSIVASPPRIHR